MNGGECGSCGSLDVVTDYGAGDVVCRGCGLVLGERIVDDTAEWRTFSNDDRGDQGTKSRVGEMSSKEQRLHGSDLTTYLVDQPTSTASSSESRPHKRPKITQESSETKRMKRNLSRIQDLAEELSLPQQIADMGLDVYERAEAKGMSVRGPEHESVSAACVFIACRQSGNARSMYEVAQASGVPKRKLGKSFLKLTRELSIEMTQPTTEEYVRRFASRLNLSMKTQTIAYDVARKAGKLGLATGKSPVAVAASVLYLAAAYTDSKRSIEEISTVSSIGAKSVKTVCKELNKSRMVLFEGVLKEVMFLFPLSRISSFVQNATDVQR